MSFHSFAIHTRSSYWTSYEHRDEIIVDSEDLALEIEQQLNELEKKGYKIISVTPINSGNIVTGTGTHYTESIIITAEIDNE